MTRINLKSALTPIYPRIRHLNFFSNHILGRIFRKKIRKSKIENAFEKISDSLEEKPIPYTRTTPSAALIELTNVCNLNCTMCNIHEQKRPTDFMKVDTFERILDQLSSIGIDRAGLYYLGETFVFPHLDRMLDVAKRRNFKIHIRSNAHYAKRIDKFHKQFPNIMNSLSFSIDGATKETFEKIRRGGKIEKVFESLETVHKINSGKINSRIDM